MSYPSTARKLVKSAQDVRFSDYATWMSRRNDSNFMRSAGNRNELGVFSFGYFSLDKQRKVTRQQAKRSNLTNQHKLLRKNLGKKLFALSLLLANACDAQPKQNQSTAAQTECEFSFKEIKTCTYNTSAYDIKVSIESEIVAEDEKTIIKIITNVNDVEQILPVSADTSILDGDLGYISFADINFDKVLDLALTTSSGTPNLYLDYWIYDVKQKKYISVGNYPKFTINENKKTLSATIKSNAETYQNIEWHWNNNKLEKK